MKKTILLIDDESYILESLYSILEDKYTVLKAQSGITGLKILKNNKIDCIILDINMPITSGLQLLKKIKNLYPDIIVIMVTAVKDIDAIIESIKLGAFYYIVKPYEVEELLMILDKALEHSDLKNEVEYLRSEIARIYDRSIIGESNKVKDILEKIENVANKNITVLIQGNSGTGKELVARAIHYRSSNRDKPFIAINCGAIPNNLIENELFGHEKGAFTGATNLKKGKFEVAGDGTLFLDEIGSMDYDMQKKLLRVLEERTFTRIGGHKNINTFAKIIAATSADLEKEIIRKNFREDLFYRLNVFPIILPDLKDRKEDIPLLVEHFIKTYRKKYNSPVKSVSPDVIKILKDYKWPGNVRQLENLIERLVLLNKKKVIDIKDIPDDFYYKVQPHKKREVILEKNLTLEKIEENYIEFSLKENNFNLTKTAESLGITRKTLRSKVKKYKISIKKKCNVLTIGSSS